jgi:hypothetical protein
MAINTIRKVTDEDWARIRAAAERFVKRHNIEPEFDSPYDDLMYRLGPSYGEADYERTERKYLDKLWTAAFRRAVRHPEADACAYGYIGYYVKD